MARPGRKPSPKRQFETAVCNLVMTRLKLHGRMRSDEFTTRIDDELGRFEIRYQKGTAILRKFRRGPDGRRELYRLVTIRESIVVRTLSADDPTAAVVVMTAEREPNEELWKCDFPKGEWLDEFVRALPCSETSKKTVRFGS